MSRITRLLRPDTHAMNWKAALPAIGLAVACLAGCAQTAVAGAPGTGTAGTASVKKVVRTGAVARFDSCAKPEYPQDALARKAIGTVTLGFLVGLDGSVRDSNVKKSSGDASLDEAARVAIAKCRFTPATADGEPVEEWSHVQYVWSLG